MIPKVSARISFLAAGVLLCAVALGGVFAQSLRDKTADGRGVVAAVPADFPPRYGISLDGKPSGMAIEMMEALAAIAKLDVTYRVFKTWDEAILAVDRGEADLIPNFGITSSRRDQFDFTEPFDSLQQSIFVRRANHALNSKDDLAGLRIGVLRTNAAVEILNRELPNVRAVVYDDAHEMVRALATGIVESVLFPESHFWSFARELNLAHQFHAIDLPLEVILRGIAVKKGNQELLNVLDAAVRTFKETGEADRIYYSWHDDSSRYSILPPLGLILLIVLGAVLLAWHLWQKSRSKIWQELVPSGSAVEIGYYKSLQVRTIVLICCVGFVALGGIGVAIYHLYDAARREQGERLIEEAQAVASLVSAVAQHDRQATGSPQAGSEATLSQVRRAYARHFGDVEILLARRVGDEIEFVLRQRHYDRFGHERQPIDSPNAAPMREALAGRSGLMRGMDYRNISVIAAYMPIKDLGLGLVVKVDQAIFRLPYLRAALWSAVGGIVLILLGIAAFLYSFRPIVLQIAQQRRQVLETEGQLADEHRRLQEILWGTDVGTWEWNVQTGATVFNERWASIIGYTLDELQPISIETWNRLGHPDDLKLSEEALKRVFERTSEHYECVARMRHRDGHWVWILDRGKVVEWAPDGKPLRMSGTHTDISAIKNLEQELRESRAELLEAQRISQVGSWYVDPADNRVIWSDEFNRIMGWKRADAPSHLSEFLSWLTLDSQQKLGPALERLQKSGAPYELEVETSGAGVRPHLWLLTRGETVRDDRGLGVGFRGIAADITARKSAQMRSDFITRLYTTLAECNAAILSCTSQEALFHRACEIIVEHGGMTMAWVGVVDAEGDRVMPVSSYGFGQSYLDGIDVSVRADEAIGRGPTGTAIRENIPVWFENFMSGGNTEPWHERARPYGWQASAALPLCRSGTPIGALTFYTTKAGFFDDETRNLLDRISRQIGFALDKIEADAAAQKALSALAESEERYRLVFDEAPLGTAVVDTADGRILNVNLKFAEITGRSVDELPGTRILDLVYPEDVITQTEHFSRLNEGGESFYGTRIRFVRKDGAVIWVSMNEAPLILPDQSLKRHLIMMRDITEELRTNKALDEQQKKFRALAEQSVVGIYAVDRGKISYINPYGARMFGYAVDEVVDQSPLLLVAEEDRGLVQANIDRRTSGKIDNLSYEFKGVRKDGTILLVAVQSTTITVDGRRMIMGVLQDVTERRQSERKIRDYVAQIENMIFGTVDAISTMVELRDPYTSGHERRVGELSAAIAAEMGLEDSVQRGLRLAGAVHDVGKLAVPSEILAKPGKLSPLEFELVRGHAQQGYEMLKTIPSPWPLAEIARQHHERIDGSGYPRALKGEDIILEARILAVADVVESMSSHRPYRPTLGIERALSEIERGSGVLYDSKVAAACLRLFREKGYSLTV